MTFSPETSALPTPFGVSPEPACTLKPRLSDDRLLIRPVERAVCPKAVELLRQIRHHGLPALRGVEQIALEADQPEQACYLFEYLPGTSLDQLTEQERVDWSFAERVSFLRELALLIDFLHHQGPSGLMHLDIKPSNLLLDRDKRPALIDFDTLQFAASDCSGGSIETAVACTPAYAAPEVLLGRPCQASDIYALGLCILKILGAFDPETDPPQLLPMAVASLEPVLASCAAKCLMTDPDQRYPRASDIAEALKGYGVEPAGESAEDSVLASEVEEKETEPDPVLHESTVDTPGFSRVYSVWNGAEFGCELAVQLRHYYASVLVIDSDLFSPEADLLLGKKNRQLLPLPQTGTDNLNMVLREIQREALTPGRLRELAWNSLAPNVDLLVFGDSLDEYDHLPPGNFFRLIEIARQTYPVVILLLNRFLYDAFTCLGLLASDQVLIPTTGSAASFRALNRSIDFLHLRRQIDPERVKFIAFPYDERTDLSLGTLNVLAHNRLLGSIQTDLARQRRRGSAKPYALAISSVNEKEYDGLIARLNHQSRKESPDADRYLARPVRRTVRLLSRPPVKNRAAR